MLTLKEVAAALPEVGLSNPVLPFLDRNPAYIRMLILQPKGVIEPTEDQVRVKDRAALTSQMKAFLALARDKEVDIAICPEYSCTWDAVLDVVANNIFPSEGKIWALGCESATTAQLATVIGSLKERVSVVYDETSVTDNGRFLDVLLYLFRTRDNTQEQKSVWTALLQPKTHPMGGTAFELHALRTGSTLYRFKNSTQASNSLVGLVCSDVLHPAFEQYVHQFRTDTVLLHLQLNDNPSSEAFRKYRTECCLHTPRTSEILCLNWARGTGICASGGEITLILEPKSILFRDKQELTSKDSDVRANDTKGCYLSNWESYRSAAFVFSPDPHIFYLETTKPSLEGLAAIAQRFGPNMLELRSWNSTTTTWEPSEALSRFDGYWMQGSPSAAALLQPVLPDFFEAERLIQLSVGKANELGWDGFWRLPSFELAPDDTICRLTLCWSTTGHGLEYRETCRSLFRGFAAAVDPGIKNSSRLSAFKNAQYSVRYRPTTLAKKFRNVHLDNGTSATCIFLGMAPSKERLSEVKKRTMNGLHQTESDKQLMAIWFRDETGQLKDFMDEDIPQINSDPEAGPVAIDNTSL